MKFFNQIKSQNLTMKNIFYALLLFPCFANAQVYNTWSGQVINSDIQCSYIGIGNGKDSSSASQLAAENAKKALDLAMKEGHVSFSNSNGGGCAVCTDLKKKQSIEPKADPSITDILFDKKTSQAVIDFENGNGSSIQYAGSESKSVDRTFSNDWINIKYQFLNKVSGERQDIKLNIIYKFDYESDYSEEYNNQNTVLSDADKKKTNTITSVRYIWRSINLNNNNKSELMSVYTKLKNEVTSKLGAPLTNDKKFSNDKSEGISTTFPDGAMLQIYTSKKDKTVYIIKLTMKLK
ncbi:MAG: hypothetical protein JWO32_378 [Bacteroidetes bacterium]|nr:hypothetical protein [Bacteroidota bacterium]